MNEDRKALRIGKNESTLSSQEFYMIFGGVLLYGFLLNAIFATFLTPVFANMNPVILLVGYFVLALAGVFMSKSGGSLLSFIGYNFVVIPSGAILSVCLLAYTQQSIIAALFIVAFDAGVMFLVSMMWPDKMLSMGRSLFIALFVGIVAEVICLLLGVSTGIFDFIFVNKNNSSFITEVTVPVDDEFNNTISKGKYRAYLFISMSNYKSVEYFVDFTYNGWSDNQDEIIQFSEPCKFTIYNRFVNRLKRFFHCCSSSLK